MIAMARLLLSGLALTLFPAAAAAQQQPIIVYPVTPAFPIFRCDGQRPPMVGAENCANWRLMKKQEQLLDLQIKELERRKRERRND